MKKLITLVALLLVGAGCQSDILGAPNPQVYQKSILPTADAVFDIGTTSLRYNARLSNLTVDGTCVGCGGGGGGSSWTTATNYGETVFSTNTPVWFLNGSNVYVSSTLYGTKISTRNASSTLLSNSGATWLTSLANCNTIDSDANGLLSCGTDATGGAGGGADTWQINANRKLAPTTTIDVFAPSQLFVSSSIRTDGRFFSPTGTLALPSLTTHNYQTTGLYFDATSTYPAIGLSIDGVRAGLITVAPATTINGLGNLFLGYYAGNNFELSTSTLSYNSTCIGGESCFRMTKGYQNTALGSRSLYENQNGYENTAIGQGALNKYTGNGATAVGFHACLNSTGGNNLCFGSKAGQGASGTATGANNVFLGANIAPAYTSATQNVIIGSGAGGAITSASTNSCAGYLSCDVLTTGGSNTAWGANALGGVTTQSFNTAMGNNAGTAAVSEGAFFGYAAGISVTGLNNTCLGSRACLTGTALTSGTNNTIVGYSAGVSTNSFTNSTAIGASAIATASNLVQLGNTSVTTVSTTGNYYTEGFHQRSVKAGIIASSNQTQGQSPLTKEINQVSVVGATNNTVTLISAVKGYCQKIINSATNTMQIFPASGDDLGFGVNTATTLVSLANVEFCAYDTTNWSSF